MNKKHIFFFMLLIFISSITVIQGNASANNITADEKKEKTKIQREKLADQAAKELVKLFGGINKYNEYKIGPLHKAIFDNKADVVKILLEEKADVNAATKEGQKPLHIAIERGYIEIVELLLEHGASVKDTDKYGAGPLHYAARSNSPNSPKIAEMLIKKGADVNLKTKDGYQPIHCLSDVRYKESVKILKILIKNGVDINSQTKRGTTILYYHIYNISLQTLALELGANPNAKDCEGNTPLHSVICPVYPEEVILKKINVLLKFGADINEKNNRGLTILDRAIEAYDAKFHNSLIKKLLKLGARSDRKDELNNTILHRYVNVAFGHLDTETIKMLVAKNNLDIDVKGKWGHTVLHDACERNYNNPAEAIRILLECGANPNAQREGGSVPLIIAIKEIKGLDILPIIKTLVKYGADLNFCNKLNETPLRAAMWNSEYALQIMELLIELGANPDFKNTKEYFPMFFCLSSKLKNKKQIIKLLLDNGADINEQAKQDDYVVTPIYSACFFYLDNIDESIEIIKYIISRGADLKQKDKRGRTPLHFLICTMGYKCNKEQIADLVKTFIDNGADIKACDNNKQTPLHYACLSGKKDLVEILLDNGAELNARDIDGKTVMHFAVQRTNEEIIKFLIDKGVNINVKDNNGETPLDYVFDHNIFMDKNKAIFILKKFGAQRSSDLGTNKIEKKEKAKKK